MDLVVSNRAATLEALAARARAQADHADVLELRLDDCAPATEPELRATFAGLGRPLLAAVNGPEAFGSFSGTDEERLALLACAERAGADSIDVPWSLAPRLASTRARRVVSRHVLEGTPEDLSAVLGELERAARPGDRLKLVTHATCAEDGLRVLALARERARAGHPIVAFASGAAGAFTRILAPIHGSLATYAAPAGAPAAATAPGQIPADVLRAAWPAGGASPRTRVFAVLGRPIAHSLSPRLHGAALRAAGLDAVYVACEPESLERFLGLCDASWGGFGVTMPFKAEAARLATERDADVEACGAANTLVRTARGWRAANTDVGAIRAAVLAGLERVGKPLARAHVVVLGTGGAARAALHALRPARARTVAGRDTARREALAHAMACGACALAEVGREPYDVLVHTTPLGSRAQAGELPLAASQLQAGAVVLDAVYDPVRTPLLRAAAAAGAVPLGGDEWFLRQASAQFRHLTGSEPDAQLMARELALALQERDQR
ncbi:MAG: type I 3-dehydroquinate dehydratase [Planctomycetes bacterium]|nr:type I 3-dehydroquinate dehydratase [Planctomycetota bacterium]